MLAVAGVLLWAQCGRKDKGGDDGPAASAVNEAVGEGQPPLPPRADDPVDPADGGVSGSAVAPGLVPTAADGTVEAIVASARSRLLTPEQFSNFVAATLGHRKTVAGRYGRTGDFVAGTHGVALGGVDFAAAMTRDPSFTPQMVLAIREVAYRLADEVVTRDRKREDAGEERFIFTLASIKSDRPYHSGDDKTKKDKQAAVREGEERWRAQLIDIHYKLYQRPMREAELAVMREAFVTFYLNERRSVPRAWVLLLMTMLSTLEVWTT